MRVVAVRRDAQVAVARRGQDAVGGERAHERVLVGRADRHQRAAQRWVARGHDAAAELLDAENQRLVECATCARVSAMPTSFISSMPAIPA